MKIKSLSLLAVAALAVGALYSPDLAQAGKEKFESTKPHTNAPDGTPKAPVVRGIFRPSDGKKPHQQPHPDLVFRDPVPGPFPGAPGSGYCGQNGPGGGAKLVSAPIRNIGTAPSGGFTVRITFPYAAWHEKQAEKNLGNIPDSPLPLPPLVPLSFAIPTSAWSNGQAHFHIFIDPNGQVDEGGIPGEKNNHAQGFCQAPAN